MKPARTSIDPTHQHAAVLADVKAKPSVAAESGQP
jgi:hypothetical protein